MAEKIPYSDFYQTDELLEILGCSYSTLRRWISLKRFPDGVKAPGGKRWKRSKVEMFLEGRKLPKPNPA